MIWGPGKLLFIHISEKMSENMIELEEADLVVGKGIKVIDIIMVLENIHIFREIAN